MRSDAIKSEIIAEAAAASGIKIVGSRNIAPIPKLKESLKIWQDKGFAGEMKYMLREPDLFVSPERLLPDAKSVISAAMEYSAEPHPPLPPGYGRVARYAWGGDYHIHFKSRLDDFADSLAKKIGPALSFRTFTDAVPLLERGFAAEAGLGFVGKNSLLIRPKIGSFFFLGEVILNFEVDSRPEPDWQGGCGACSRCMESCPTGAIVEPTVVDARKCISYLTIEKRGLHTEEERRGLGEWVFGCDVCQEVCPFNHAPQKGAISPEAMEFSRDSGVGPLLNLAEILGIRGEDEFRKRFSGTALLRPKREGLLRNAAAAAANTHSFCAAKALLAAVREDSSEVVRAQSLWAAKRLREKASGEDHRLLVQAVDIGKNDPSELVRREAV